MLMLACYMCKHLHVDHVVLINCPLRIAVCTVNTNPVHSAFSLRYVPHFRTFV